MEISQITLVVLLLYSFFSGVLVGLLRDLLGLLGVALGLCSAKRQHSHLSRLHLPVSFRPLNAEKKRGILQSIAINIFDLVSILSAACSAILLAYGYNSGRVRFFSLAAIAAGFFLYRLMLGRALIFLLEPIALLLKYLLLSICDILTLAFRKLYALMRKIAKKFSSLYIFTLENENKKLYNIREEVFLSENDGVTVPKAVKNRRRSSKKGRKGDGEK